MLSFRDGVNSLFSRLFSRLFRGFEMASTRMPALVKPLILDSWPLNLALGRLDCEIRLRNPSDSIPTAMPSMPIFDSTAGEAAISAVRDAPFPPPDARPAWPARHRSEASTSGERRARSRRPILGLLCAGKAMAAAICGGLWLASALGESASAQVKLPDIGEGAGGIVSAEDERRLGKEFMRSLRTRFEIIDEPPLDEYIRGLGNALAANSDPARDTVFTFFVLDDEEINAFAAPGGFIGIHAGLFLATRSEGELASVIAHEIAHISQRHILQSLERSSRANLPTMAGILVALLLGSQNAEVGQAAVASVIGSAMQQRIDFTREKEAEADRIGIRLLAKAGFDPLEMANFFRILERDSRFRQRPLPFLSTHPITGARLAEAHNIARGLEKGEPPDPLGYHVVHTWLQVRNANDPGSLLRRFEDEAAAGQNRASPDNPEANEAIEAANRYGRALALIRLGREAKARETLAPLVERYPLVLAFRSSLASSLLRAGENERAIDLYAAGAELLADSPGMIGGFAKALIDDGQSQRALEEIDRFARDSDIDARLARLRAKALQMLGRGVDSRIALAESYALADRLDAAIGQLLLALEAEKSGTRQSRYRLSRIDTRLAELRSERNRRR